MYLNSLSNALLYMKTDLTTIGHQCTALDIKVVTLKIILSKQLKLLFSTI